MSAALAAPPPLSQEPPTAQQPFVSLPSHPPPQQTSESPNSLLLPRYQCDDEISSTHVRFKGAVSAITCTDHYVVTGDMAGVICLWLTTTVSSDGALPAGSLGSSPIRPFKQLLPPHAYPITQLAATSDQMYLVSLDQSGLMRTTALPAPDEEQQMDDGGGGNGENEWDRPPPLAERATEGFCMCMADDDRSVILGGYLGELTVYPIEKGDQRLKVSVPLRTGMITCLSTSFEKRKRQQEVVANTRRFESMVAYGSEEGLIGLLRLMTHRDGTPYQYTPLCDPQKPFHHPIRSVSLFKAHPAAGGARHMLAASDSEYAVFRLDTRRPAPGVAVAAAYDIRQVSLTNVSHGWVTQLQIHPTLPGLAFVTASTDGLVRVWRRLDNRSSRYEGEVLGRGNNAAWHPTGMFIAVSDDVSAPHGPYTHAVSLVRLYGQDGVSATFIDSRAEQEARERQQAEMMAAQQRAEEEDQEEGEDVDLDEEGEGEGEGEAAEVEDQENGEMAGGDEEGHTHMQADNEGEGDGGGEGGDAEGLFDDELEEGAGAGAAMDKKGKEGYHDDHHSHEQWQDAQMTMD
ncbi:unnamed protein product [Vitrella brassicaformis CCMP3155]|uniref:Uncharacterized protein n=2 Tax=Vitrella brassicaformis TaxID=1169539 RepID=A0A0G4EUB5_VITBC|nr:unnamed protein product [Vitrella brassicaformis CCMP3155]|eukprot:CEM01883.1 unnamed protein product [Vitrella brassicaformis CCMP3155]